MGFFSGLAEEKYDREYSDRLLIKRISGYFLPYKKRLGLISLMVVLMAVFGALMPVLVSNGVDLLAQQTSSLLIYVLCGVVMLVGVLQWVSNWVRRRLTVRTIADVISTLSKDGFEAAANHDLSFYDEFSSGRIVSRLTSDTREFGNLVVLLTDLISQIIQAIILAVVLLNIDIKLSLYLFAMIPLIFIMAISFRQIARKVTRDGMRAMANVNATIKETVSGISVAKNFRQEISINKDFNQANQQSYLVNVRRGLVLAMVFPLLNAIGGVTSAVLVYYGGLTALQGVVTAGAWYLFLLSQDRFMYPVMNLSSFWTQIQTGLSAAERVFALIDAEPVVVQVDNQKVNKLVGDIEFKNLYFSYKPEEPILKNFSIKIKPGENIAFVGHTGAGKSTIVKLIERFYEFQNGQLLIDGKDIRSFDLESYRKQLGIVTQVPFLFSDTVANNIRYGRQEAGDAEILEIARQIGDGEWLDTLPDGLHTQVGERGALLSMGQRQLVALMRVLVQKPAIFILDEATASIDPFTEWQIQQALKLVLANTTSILIAHRLSTVKSADRIIVMADGGIIEEGNHETLMDIEGHYSNLYNTYFRHQSLEYVENSRQFYGISD